MSGGRVLDLEALLAPISETAPTGTDLRDDSSPQSLYYRLKDARTAARAAERAGDTPNPERPPDPPDWRTPLDLAKQALTKQTKDLEVAAWLIEAATRLHGFAGFLDGIELVRGLVGTYWDGVHSLRDEEGMTTFVAPLAGLNGVDAEGTLIQPIRKVPITTGDPGPYAAYHYAQAEALGRITDKAARERQIASGVPTVEVFEKALRASDKAFLRQTLKDLAASIAAITALADELEAKCGQDAPPLSAIRKALEAIDDLVRSRTRDIIPPEPPAIEAASEAEEAPVTTNGAAGPAAAAAPAGAITTRDDALRVLVKIAEYFRANEPHSPIAFALDDLVRRARMSLPELLAELLPDANARRTFLTAAGIRPPADG
jgi:type VI secretion system protein ImpA